MPVDTSVHPQSRRALLAGALGGLAAAVAAALGRPSPTSAAAGSPLIIGSEANNAGTADTQLRANSSVVTFKLYQQGPGTALMGYTTPAMGATRGVYGRVDSPNGDGVQGRNAGAAGTGAAIRAYGGNNDGVVATTVSNTRYAVKAIDNSGLGSAVWGSSEGGVGVAGEAPSGYGVSGNSSSLIGVRGNSTGGYGVYGDLGQRLWRAGRLDHRPRRVRGFEQWVCRLLCRRSVRQQCPRQHQGLPDRPSARPGGQGADAQLCRVERAQARLRRGRHDRRGRRGDCRAAGLLWRAQP